MSVFDFDFDAASGVGDGSRAFLARRLRLHAVVVGDDSCALLMHETNHRRLFMGGSIRTRPRWTMRRLSRAFCDDLCQLSFCSNFHFIVEQFVLRGRLRVGRSIALTTGRVENEHKVRIRKRQMPKKLLLLTPQMHPMNELISRA